MPPRSLARAIALALVLVACSSGDEDHFVRGHALRVASVGGPARARIYEAALSAAFELNDPALTLLLDRRLLPRGGGFAEEARIHGPVEKAMRDQGVIKGVCEPPITGARATPRCTARGPGYVVRFSDVLRRGGDSVEVYVAVQKYDTPASGSSESLRFERAYQLVGSGERWRPTREARVRETTPAPVPGAPRAGP